MVSFLFFVLKISTTLANFVPNFTLKHVSQVMYINVLKGISLTTLINTVICHINTFWGVTTYNLSKSYTHFGRPCYFLIERTSLGKKEKFSPKIQCLFIKPSTVFMDSTARISYFTVKILLKTLLITANL